MYLRIILVAISVMISMDLYAETVFPKTPIFNASPDGETLVKSVSYGEGGNYAKAIFYHNSEKIEDLKVSQSFDLVDGRLPKSIFVSNNGSLVTLDDWNAYGRGENVIVVYNNKGVVQKKYSLNDLYPGNKVKKFLVTSSSIYWRCVKVAPNVYYEKQLHIYDYLGGELILDKDSGEIVRYRKHSDVLCPDFP